MFYLLYLHLQSIKYPFKQFTICVIIIGFELDNVHYILLTTRCKTTTDTLLCSPMKPKTLFYIIVYYCMRTCIQINRFSCNFTFTTLSITKFSINVIQKKLVLKMSRLQELSPLFSQIIIITQSIVQLL